MLITKPCANTGLPSECAGRLAELLLHIAHRTLHTTSTHRTSRHILHTSLSSLSPYSLLTLSLLFSHSTHLRATFFCLRLAASLSLTKQATVMVDSGWCILSEQVILIDANDHLCSQETSCITSCITGQITPLHAHADPPKRDQRNFAVYVSSVHRNCCLRCFWSTIAHTQSE